MKIDTTFDFRTGMNGKDPDGFSEELRQCHQFLWSKPLPIGGCLDLDDHLVNQSAVGTFRVSSDSIIHTFSYWRSYQHIIEQIPKEAIEHFDAESYTIGGMIVFPASRINRKYTINQARGRHQWIMDRIDLTLECIRLYYLGSESPLYDCLCRYDFFFRLFGDFRGYIEFFLMQDMVNEREMTVRFMHPFTEFGKHVLPETPEEYIAYMDNCLDFIHRRNQRIAAWATRQEEKTISL